MDIFAPPKGTRMNLSLNVRPAVTMSERAVGQVNTTVTWMNRLAQQNGAYAKENAEAAEEPAAHARAI